MTHRVFRENPTLHLISRLNSPPTKTHTNTRPHSHVLGQAWCILCCMCAHYLRGQSATQILLLSSAADRASAGPITQRSVKQSSRGPGTWKYWRDDEHTHSQRYTPACADKYVLSVSPARYEAPWRVPPETYTHKDTHMCMIKHLYHLSSLDKKVDRWSHTSRYVMLLRSFPVHMSWFQADEGEGGWAMLMQDWSIR